MCPTQQFLQTLVSCLQLPCGILLIPSLHFPYSLSIPGFPVAIGRPCSHMQTLIFTLLPLSLSLYLLLHLSCLSVPHTVSLCLTLSTCSSHALLSATDISFIQPGCSIDEGSTIEQHKSTGQRSNLPAHCHAYKIHYILTTLP